MENKAVAAMIQTKSVGVAVILTVLFGGLGVFYVSIVGGIVMGIITAIAWLITVATLGIAGFVLVPIVHGIAIIWAIVGVNNHNKKLVASLNQ